MNKQINPATMPYNVARVVQMLTAPRDHADPGDRYIVAPPMGEHNRRDLILVHAVHLWIDRPFGDRALAEIQITSDARKTPVTVVRNMAYKEQLEGSRKLERFLAQRRIDYKSKNVRYEEDNLRDPETSQRLLDPLDEDTFLTREVNGFESQDELFYRLKMTKNLKA